MHATASFDDNAQPLVLSDLPRPVPGAGEILLRVLREGTVRGAKVLAIA